MTESQTGKALRRDWASDVLTRQGKAHCLWWPLQLGVEKKAYPKVSSYKASAQELTNLLQERCYIWGSSWSFSHHSIRFRAGVTHSSRSEWLLHRPHRGGPWRCEKRHVLCRSQPTDDQDCDWTSLCGSYYDCTMPSAITVRKHWEKRKLYYLQVLEIT